MYILKNKSQLSFVNKINWNNIFYVYNFFNYLKNVFYLEIIKLVFLISSINQFVQFSYHLFYILL